MVTCALCKKQIESYNPVLNHLRIDEFLSADICQGCADKFLRWQQGIYARLFPTKLAKKRSNQ